MKPTMKMTIDELLEEKENLERKEKLGSQEKARLNKLENEIKKKNNKISIIDTFTNNELKSQLQLQYINISDIVMPFYDDRSGIDKDKIESLALSIKNHGLIQNPVLKDLGNGKYEKKVGRRRILASKLNGDEKILVKILPSGLTEEQEDFIIWDENNQREDLNLYDKVRFHLKFISRVFNLEKHEDAIALINNCHYYKKQKDNASVDNQKSVKIIEEILFKLGSYKTISSLMNNLQVLNFNVIVLDAMKENKISYRLAYLLNKSIKQLEEIYNNDLTKVMGIIHHIIKEEYSVTEAEKYINSLIKKHVVRDELEIIFDKTIRQLNKKLYLVRIEDKEKTISLLNKLMEEI